MKNAGDWRLPTFPKGVLCGGDCGIEGVEVTFVGDSEINKLVEASDESDFSHCNFPFMDSLPEHFIDVTVLKIY